MGVGEKDSIRESSVWRKVSLDQKALRIGTGSCTSYAIMEDGSARAWGMGNNLQLTTGEEDDEWEPIYIQGKKLEGMKVKFQSFGYRFLNHFSHLTRNVWNEKNCNINFTIRF